ncbi:MAG TPA: hypothetical protein VIV11_02485 [Kofleriaceae bacterium]
MRMVVLVVSIALVSAACNLYFGDSSGKSTTPDAGIADAGQHWPPPDAPGPYGDGGFYPDASSYPDGGIYPDAGPYGDGGCGGNDGGSAPDGGVIFPPDAGI